MKKIRNEDQEEVLTQALTRIKDIQKTRFLPLALELDGEDHYQFMRAYSPGLQEYIEAVSFYHYLKYSQLVSLTAVQQDLQFSRQDAILHTSPGGASETVVVSVPPMEFMLGIADLTGELMRTAIMSVSAGNLDFPIQACKFMRVIHDAFMSFNKKEEDFNTLQAYNDYLEMVETIIFNLANGTDVEQTRKMIEQYKKENKDLIKKNQSKLSRDEEYLEHLIEQEKHEAAVRRQLVTEEEQREKNLKKRNKDALIDELRAQMCGFQ
nr:hypothetical protein BaRGS_012277 [Batillaria attramentaria]